MEAIKTGISEESIRIEGLTCESCESRIREALLGLKGVSSVEVSSKTGIALVRFEGATVGLAAIHHAISDTGYRVRESAREEKPGFWTRMRKKLREFKEEIEKDSVGKSNLKVVDCCHPPEELLKKKK